MRIVEVFIAGHCGDETALECVEVLLLDRVMIDGMKRYPYSSLWHGRVKKVYKTLLTAGNDDWVKSSEELIE